MLPLLTAFITLGTPDDYITNVATWSVPIFTGLVVLALSFAGIVIGALVVRKLGRATVGAVKSITGGPKKRMGRRRY